MKLITTLIGIVLVMPIWFYLLYKLLIAADATELMWFLYFIYTPAALFARILVAITENKKIK